MFIGAVYPQVELDGDPEALHRIAVAVEEVGYQHLLMYDHVVGAARVERTPPLWGRGPYTDQHPFHDPLVAFGYCAGITKRIELVTGILILPQRQTVLAAKQATDVALLSGGRLRLGVGLGWNYVEYDSLGMDFHTRGKRLDEQIPLLRRLWDEPLVTHFGQIEKIDRANILPRPKTRIPIYCGGIAEPAYRRAAKMADGFIFGGPIEHALEGWRRVQDCLKEEGRPLEGFGAHFIIQDIKAAGLTFGEKLEAVQRWQDAGGTHASILTMGCGFRETGEHLDHFSEVWAALSARGLPA